MIERRLEDDAGRDEDLSVLYRAAPREEPPSRLDDAIQAAARRAVHARPRSAPVSFNRRWGVPAAVAAVLVLSISVVTLMREEAPPELTDLGSHEEGRSRGVSPSVGEGRSPGRLPSKSGPAATGVPAPESEAPASTAPALTPSIKADAQNSVSPARPAEPPAKERKRAEPFPSAAAPVATIHDGGVGRRPEQRSQEETSHGREALQEGSKKELGVSERLLRDAPPMHPSAPATAGQFTRQVQPDAAAERDVRETPEAQAPRARQKAAPAAAAGAPVTPPLPVEKWLANIETLRKEGRTDEARKSLAEFQKHYPDYPVPQALKDALQP